MAYLNLRSGLPFKLIVILTLFPLTTFSASFDCAKSNIVVEHIICEAEEVSTKDDKMATIYSSIKSTLSKKKKQSLILSQRQFLLLRNRCHQSASKKLTVDSVFRARDCLLKAYENRIAEIKEWSKMSAYSAPKLEPKEAPNTEAKCPKINESELVFIPGGTFYMGSSDGAYSDEKPRHKVTVDGFCVSKMPLERGWMSFNESIEYLRVLSINYEVNFRLITEAEWEYVASMGTVDNKYDVVGLMDDWELTSTIYTRYPYDKNDGREDLYANETHRVLRGGHPLDPIFDYEPSITLRGYARQDSKYLIRIATTPLN